jgi:hypothetical protein
MITSEGYSCSGGQFALKTRLLPFQSRLRPVLQDIDVNFSEDSSGFLISLVQTSRDSKLFAHEVFLWIA